MTVSPQGMSVQALYRLYRDESLLVNRQYQRKLVWTVSEKQRLIDSLLQDYPLPLFLFAEITNSEGKTVMEVIDGMQRLNAIFSYIEQGFTWEDQAFDIEEFTRARHAAEAGVFAPLSNDVRRLDAKSCANLLDYQLAVTVFPGEQSERITQVFGRINSGGKQLSDQERRQAGVLTPFAETIRALAAEIRGDVSRETLLLSQMPEISIETSRNPHGYNLKAEDIFWCYQGILRTGDLRNSDDEQVLADICASILFDEPVEASGDFLDKLYNPEADEHNDVNTRLNSYGREKLIGQVKMVFSMIRKILEDFSTDRFFFRSTVYPKPTSNAQKSPFFAVFMAFYELVFKEGMTPSNTEAIIKSLNNLTDRIKVGQKHIKTVDRKENVSVVNGLIRGSFVKSDVAALAHGPGMIFDFENSIRRSKTETPRYEFKQGILRLDSTRDIDEALLSSLVNTMCAIANVGPDADGYIFLGIADKLQDAERIKALDRVEPASFEHVKIVGIDREATVLGVSLDRYMRKLEDAIFNSGMNDPLKTQILSAMDVVTFKGHSVLRIRIPKQTSISFVSDDCFVRNGTSTHRANGPQIAAISKLFM
ncbi:GmrSD restriction endonuclease domain-containing protein [Thalassospira marina]|uniref:GmrSD restriction endonucleases N-terminal domain-containing protein n=1 Tax=Thalassospira marina TaxID=2048283 RepID=A0A2N3KZZ8_9PROT|nr:DUF262 domain-containing protein [Thalassospira marina]PKR56144.1 hypothetical protein COO20_02795 [Thalassospira marina]